MSTPKPGDLWTRLSDSVVVRVTSAEGRIVIVPDHDDYACLDDFEAAGLVQNVGSGANPRLWLTDKGWKMAGRLRRHKAEGGQWASFNAGRKS